MVTRLEERPAVGDAEPPIATTRRPGLAATRSAASSTAGIVVLVATVGVVAVGLFGGSPDPSRVDTVVRGLTGQVQLVQGGTTRVLAVGDEVPRGGVLTTAAGADVVLATGGRATELGPDSRLTVRDGTHQRLDRGRVLLDARRGPALVLDTDVATVRTRRSSVTRVERGTQLRVAGYRGSVSVQAADRRGTEPVTALHEVQVPLGGVPGAETALALTPGDAWERRPDVAGSLVMTEDVLIALAARLDRTSMAATAVAIVPLPLRQQAPTVTGARPSEQVLGYAVSQAGGGGGDQTARYRTVRGDRDSGGSWGVVAALATADTGLVTKALDALLATAPTGTGGTGPGSTVPGTAGLLDEVVAGLPGVPGALPVPAGPTAPGASPRSPGSLPRPTTPGTPSSPSSPVPTPPGPLPLLPPSPLPVPVPVPAPGAVGGVVNGVLGLLAPVATVPTTPAAPRTAPARLRDLGGLRLG